jgi:hypothetical protein
MRQRKNLFKEIKQKYQLVFSDEEHEESAILAEVEKRTENFREDTRLLNVRYLIAY